MPRGSLIPYLDLPRVATPARAEIMGAMNARITRINPESLHPTPGYHHVTITEAGRTAYLAGQCPLGPSGDSWARATSTLSSTRSSRPLCGPGRRRRCPADVVRSVIYVVSDDAAVLGRAWARLRDSPLAAAFGTASTLLGVAALGFSGQLIEVDLTVALPG